MKYYIGFVVVLIVSGLGFMLYFGLQPKPIPKIRLSSFESATVVANSLTLRLSEEIRQHPVVIWGVTGRSEQEDITERFLQVLQGPGMKFDFLMVDLSLKSLGARLNAKDIVDLKENMNQVGKIITETVNAGKRILILVPSIHSYQKIKGNFANRLKQDFALKPMSFTLINFPRTREQESIIDIPCVVGAIDSTGTGILGCDVLQTARLLYRKQLKPGVLSGQVDQTGLDDYLVLITPEP